MILRGPQSVCLAVAFISLLITSQPLPAKEPTVASRSTSIAAAIATTAVCTAILTTAAIFGIQKNLPINDLPPGVESKQVEQRAQELVAAKQVDDFTAPINHPVMSPTDFYGKKLPPIQNAFGTVENVILVNQPLVESSTPVDPKDYVRVTRDVRKAFSRYPQDFIQQHVDRVYFSNTLRSEGAPAGGLCADLAFCVAVGPESIGVESTFHHEFAHHLVGHHSWMFSERAWKRTLPRDFKYEGSTVMLRIEGKAGTPAPELFDEGFYIPYGTADQAEDIAVIAQYLFSADPAFWKAVDSSPRLQAKVKILSEFYRKLDNRFSEYYFRSLKP